MSAQHGIEIGWLAGPIEGKREVIAGDFLDDHAILLQLRDRGGEDHLSSPQGEGLITAEGDQNHAMARRSRCRRAA